MNKTIFSLLPLLRLVIVFILIAGCSSRPASHVKVTPTLKEESKSIVEIARQAMAKNDSWVERAEFELPQHQPDGKWSVMVWRLPKTPGGFRVIAIDQNGKVTEYLRGH